MSNSKLHYVWDAGTRWFHWINAISVLALMGLGLLILNASSFGIPNPGKALLKTIHVLVGYVFALNLLWRFAWAFLGNPHARWRAILPGGKGYFAELRDYCRSYFSSSPKRYLGHNPAGRLAVAAMLLLMTIQMLTGLFLAGSDVFYPPFGHWIAEWIAAPGVDPATLQPYAVETYNAAAYEEMRAIRKPLATIHLYSFYGLATLVILHLFAVVLGELRERSSLVSAMIGGSKLLPSDAAGTESRQNP